MLGLRFECADPTVARFRAALIRLRLEGAGLYGANVLAHDVALNLALARRLRLPGHAARLERAVLDALDEVNQLRVRSWQAALALAEAEMPVAHREHAVASLVFGLRKGLGPACRQLLGVQSELEAASGLARGRGNLLVASALAASFTFLLVPACGGVVGQDSTGGGGRDASAVQDAGSDASASADSATDAGSDDAGPDASEDAGSVVFIDAEPACTASVTATQHSMLDQAVDACLDCDLDDPDFDFRTEYGVVLDGQGRAVDVTSGDGSVIPDDVRQCYLEALAGQTFPCLGGETLWQTCVICLF
jgi:hypothetical protein